MNKIPVGASIAHAYEFLFGRFFQIVGTAWLPALLYGLGYYVYLQAMLAAMPIHGADGAAIAAALGTVLLALAFFLVIRSVLGISLTQEALGVRKDLTLAHFVLGPRELRLFFGYLRYYLLYILLYAGLLAVGFGMVFAARKWGSGFAPHLAFAGQPIAVVAARVASAVLGIVFALAMLRLLFLLGPIASAEHRTRLAHAWALTRGSTLRIFAVLLVTFLPLAIAAGFAAYYLFGPDVHALLKSLHPGDARNAALVRTFVGAHVVTLSAFLATLVACGSALLAGASAAAYRAAIGHEDPEPEDDAALVAPLLMPAPASEPARHEEPPAHGHDDHPHGDLDQNDKDDVADQGHVARDHGGHGHESHDDHGHEAHAPDEHVHDDHATHAQDDHDGQHAQAAHAAEDAGAA